MDKIIKNIFFVLALAIFIFTITPRTNAIISTSQYITVTLLNQNPDPVQSGNYVELRWKIENEGGSPTDNFIFKLKPDYPFSLDPGIDPEQKLGKIDSYQIGEDAYVVYYKLKVDENADEGDYSIDYEYSTDNGKSWIKKSSTIHVEERDFVVLVDNIKTNPQMVSPGHDINVSFTLENDASSEIYDVRVKLTLQYVDTTTSGVVRTELPFSPKSSTNEQLVKVLKPREKKVFTFPLTVNLDAGTKVHKIPLIITYKNNEGTEFTKELLLGIPVYDKPKYMFNIESSEIYKEDMKGRITISLSNIGVSKMKFLAIKLLPSSDYDVLSYDKTYIGNLDSDDFETADFEIYTKRTDDVNLDKSIKLKFKITYRDEYNKEFNNIVEAPLRLYSQKEAIKYGFEKKQSYTNKIISFMVLSLLTLFWLSMLIDSFNSRKKDNKWIWFLVVLLGYILGALIYFFFRRRVS